MKVETPQILWHNGSEGNGKPAPLYSVSLLPSPSPSPSPSSMNGNRHGNGNSVSDGNGDILATSGNTNEVHIWKINFPLLQQQQQQSQQSQHQPPPPMSSTSSSSSSSSPTQGRTKRQKILSASLSNISHISTVTRHQRSVNTIAFSPLGTHLATAGDGGSFIIHTVPSPYRNRSNTNTNTNTNTNNSTNANNANRSQLQATNLFWKTQFTSEKDLDIKVINTHAEDVMDLSWSNDEKRVILGSLDHSVFVFEESFSKNNNSSHGTSSYSTSYSTSSSTTSSNVSNVNGMNSGNAANLLENSVISGRQSQSQWSCVWRNTKEHTHYVQGVAYDPLGVYLASQGTDRSVRVWQRKKGNHKTTKSKKAVLAVMDSNANANANVGDTNVLGANNGNIANGGSAGIGTDRTAAINERLSGKFEVGKAKVLKYRNLVSTSTAATTSTNAAANNSSNNNNNNDNNNNDLGMNENGNQHSHDENKKALTTATASTHTNTNTTSKRRHLFADESTVESFFRRLAWTNDGAFLITPASLYHNANVNVSPRSPLTTDQTQHQQQQQQPSSASSSSSQSSPSFATYLFARHQYDRPYKVLSGLEKPSVVIRPNPILFQLPKDAQSNSKENMNIKQNSCLSSASPLLPSSTSSSLSSSSISNHHDNHLTNNIPYRSIFAVLTIDSILIYDTYHSRPLCIARGLHYAGLTDCTWSSNGRNLVVCSTDGYVSILSFAEGELGDVYVCSDAESVSASTSASASTNGSVNGNGNVNGNANSTFRNAAGGSSGNGSTFNGVVQVNQNRKSSISPASVLPPCEPGQSALLVAPPAKRARVDNSNNINGSHNHSHNNVEKKRIAPTLLSNVECKESKEDRENTENSENKNDMNTSNSNNTNKNNTSMNMDTTTGHGNNNSMETEVVGAVTNLSIDSDLQRKVNHLRSIC